MKAQREIGGIALLINLGAKWGVCGQRHPSAVLHKESLPESIFVYVGWVPGSFWTGFGER